MPSTLKAELLELADWCRNEAVELQMTGEDQFADQIVSVAERIEELVFEAP